MENKQITGHLSSLVTIIIWGTTFISTKILLVNFQPIEILFFRFLIGFIVLLVVYPKWLKKTTLKQEFNFAGDILALAASFIWAVYSLFTKKISGYEYNTIQTTRRIFIYGIIFIIPLLFVFGFELDFMKFAEAKSLFNMAFLGVGASALCFVTWNYAIKLLGAVKTSVYIYIVPVITVIVSAVILDEKITSGIICGTALTLAGLFLSESKLNFKKKEIQIKCTRI